MTTSVSPSTPKATSSLRSNDSPITPPLRRNLFASPERKESSFSFSPQALTFELEADEPREISAYENGFEPTELAELLPEALAFEAVVEPSVRIVFESKEESEVVTPPRLTQQKGPPPVRAKKLARSKEEFDQSASFTLERDGYFYLLLKEAVFLPLVILDLVTGYTGLDYTEVKWQAADLSEKNLASFAWRQSLLARANFSFSRLHNCSFIDSDLGQVNFSHARLTNLSLDWPSFRDADFSHALLQNCRLLNRKQRPLPLRMKQATLRTTLLQRLLCTADDASASSFYQVSFDNCRFETVNFDHAHFEEIRFLTEETKSNDLIACTFTAATFTNFDLSPVTIGNCCLDHSVWNRVIFGHELKDDELGHTCYYYYRCSFKGATFSNCNFDSAMFSDCDFTGASFDSGCSFFGANFRNCVLHQTNFSKAEPGSTKRACLEHVMFRLCSVKETSFVGAELTQISFRVEDLSGLLLKDALLTNCVFKKPDLGNVVITGLQEGSTYTLSK